MADLQSRFKPHEDYAELQKLFPYIRQMQALADRHGVTDIFQDNGGKLLQLALLLGFKVLDKREGNDAIDVTTAGEMEMKTVNIKKRQSFTTHHHLNRSILAKYRKVEWVFATYQTIELERVWLMQPDRLESYFSSWERQLGLPDKAGKPRSHLNNPQIPISHVERYGQLIHTGPGPFKTVTPIMPTTLDPFSGSGSFAKALTKQLSSSPTRTRPKR